jgi:hypothetical protein
MLNRIAMVALKAAASSIANKKNHEFTGCAAGEHFGRKVCGETEFTTDYTKNTKR